MPDIQREREDLAKADHHIMEGEKRITEQIIRIQRMKDAGQDTTQAEAMLWTFEKVLEAWKAHRQAILDIIARLE